MNQLSRRDIASAFHKNHVRTLKIMIFDIHINLIGCRDDETIALYLLTLSNTLHTFISEL